MSELFAIQFDREAQTYRVSGEMTLDTATEIVAETASLFDQAPTVTIDLTAVSRADSAGLALLITWMRQAKKSGKTISFHNLPTQMQAIASASGLDEFLPIQ